MNLTPQRLEQAADELGSIVQRYVLSAGGDASDVREVCGMIVEQYAPDADAAALEADLKESDEAEFVILQDGQEIRMPRDV